MAGNGMSGFTTIRFKLTSFCIEFGVKGEVDSH
jgi:hypothetical protein